MWDQLVWETSRQLSLAAFIDSASCEPVCAQTQVQTHTHTRTCTGTTAENTPDQWELWNAGFVSLLTLVTFHWGGSMRVHCCLSVSHLRPADGLYDALSRLSVQSLTAQSPSVTAPSTITVCLNRQKIKIIPLICELAGGRWPEMGSLGLRLSSHHWLEKINNFLQKKKEKIHTNVEFPILLSFFILAHMKQ